VAVPPDAGIRKIGPVVPLKMMSPSLLHEPPAPSISQSETDGPPDASIFLCFPPGVKKPIARLSGD